MKLCCHIHSQGPERREGRCRLVGFLQSFRESFQKLPRENSIGPNLTFKETGKCSLTSGQPYVQLQIPLLKKEYRFDGMNICPDVK